MFTYRMQVRLKDTDATGVLYFAEQFKMAMDVFEEFLKERGAPFRQLLDSNYLMPVVHAEADYLAPLMVGDELQIELGVAKIGTSSVTLIYTFYDVIRKMTVGRVKIVHVAIERHQRSASVPIPDFLRNILEPELIL